MKPREWTIKWDDEFQYRDGVSAYIQIAEGNEANEHERVKVIEKSWADAEIARLEKILEEEAFTNYSLKKLKAERGRMFFVAKPKLFIDGNKWCALLGDNIQSGVVGFGDSPDEAARAFVFAWFAKIK